MAGWLDGLFGGGTPQGIGGVPKLSDDHAVRGWAERLTKEQYNELSRQDRNAIDKAFKMDPRATLKPYNILRERWGVEPL